MAKKIDVPKLLVVKQEIEDAIAAIYERHGLADDAHLTTHWLSTNPMSTFWGLEKTDGKILAKTPAIKVDIKICEW